MHILLILSVSTLAALPANFELHFKNRQAGNFRQAGNADIGLGLGNEASGSHTTSACHSSQYTGRS
jgi:hypothetical protein